jgi:hypothetical protein
MTRVRAHVELINCNRLIIYSRDYYFRIDKRRLSNARDAAIGIDYESRTVHSLPENLTDRESFSRNRANAANVIRLNGASKSH